MFWATGLPRWTRGRPYWPDPYLPPEYSREDEVAMLKEDAEMLKRELETMERRMSDLQSKQKNRDVRHNPSDDNAVDRAFCSPI
jgi:hypothetical protein